MNVLYPPLILVLLVLCHAGSVEVLAQSPARSPRDMIAASERIIERNREQGVETKPGIYYFLSSAYLQVGMPDEALQSLVEGLEIAEKNNEELVTANLILLQSVALNQLGRSEEGATVLRQGLPVARKLGNRRLEAKMETELGSNLVQLAQTSAAVAAYGRAIRLASEVGDEELATPAKLNLVTLLSQLAAEDVAINKLEEMLENASGTRNTLWKCSIELNLASSLAKVGRLDEAKEYIRSAQKELSANGNRFLAATAWFNMALIYEMQGDVEAAARCLETARFQAQQGGGPELLKTIQQKLDQNNIDSVTTLDAFLANLEEQLRDSPPPARRREILQALAECEALRGNWRQVASYQADLYQLSETLNVETIQAEVKDLLQKLEGQQQELRVAEDYSARLVAENRLEKSLRQSQLESTRLSYGLLAAVLCCVGLVIWVCVRRAFTRRWALSQKEVEGVLRTANNTWKSTFDGLDDAVCTITADGTIKLYNTAFQQLFGASLQEDVETNVDGIVSHYFDEQNVPFKGIHKLRYGNDGFEKWFRIDRLSLPMDMDPSEDADAILVIRDVSADIRIRETMLASQRAAEDATKEKSEFVAIVSHELRTPLAAICGASELIREESKLTATSEPLFRAISNASSRLSRLIDDLLDYSSIDRGKVVLANAPFSPLQIAEDCLRPIEQSRPDLCVKLDVDALVPKFVLGDEVRYSQILSNLLANAERATEEGGISIQITASFPTTQSVELVTVVEDTGVGIPTEKQERVFEPFEQASCSDRRKNGGAGLGLAICRSLARAMGGDISMTSTFGVGTVFSFSTQFTQIAEPVVADKGVLESQNPLRVLVVDDDDICRMITARLVTSLGHEVDTATCGAEAVELAGNRESEYDVVMMDLMMPGMSGLEATAKIRLWATAEDLPIFALTAKTAPTDRQTSRSAGINAYLVKPVTREKLARELALVTPGQPGRDQDTGTLAQS